MDGINLIVLLVIIYVLFFNEINKRVKTLISPKNQNSVGNESLDNSSQIYRYVRKIQIEGTQPDSTPSVVSSYGINPGSVGDCRSVRGPAVLDSSLVACLQHIQRNGGARGLRIADMLYNQKMLQDGESLYFILTEGPSPQLIAFIEPTKK